MNLNLSGKLIAAPINNFPHKNTLYVYSVPNIPNIHNILIDGEHRFGYQSGVYESAKEIQPPIVGSLRVAIILGFSK